MGARLRVTEYIQVVTEDGLFTPVPLPGQPCKQGTIVQFEIRREVASPPEIATWWCVQPRAVRQDAEARYVYVDDAHPERGCFVIARGGVWQHGPVLRLEEG